MESVHLYEDHWYIISAGSSQRTLASTPQAPGHRFGAQ